MTPLELKAELDRRGVILLAVGGRLRYCPASRVDDDLLSAMRQHKTALLALLGQARPPEAPPVAPAIPPAHAPDTGGRVGQPATKEAVVSVPHELSLAERVASGYVNPGWSATAWAARLRQLADRCAAVRPELAATYRQWAANVEIAT